MKLKFLGNGSGFSNTHTGAYFTIDDNIIFIDCSMLNVNKMVELSKDFQNVYVYITHMHLDHISGLGLFVQYMHYTQSKKLNIRVPINLIENVEAFLKLTGIPLDICDLNIILKENEKFELTPILTSHAIELRNKCYGYLIEINDEKLIYTGDTNTLLPFLKYKDNVKEFYIDVSASYGSVHLKYDNIKDTLFELSKQSEIYIMHIDNEQLMNKLIENTPFKIAEI